MSKSPVSKLDMDFIRACTSSSKSRASLHSALQDEKFCEHARWIAIVIATWQRIETQLSILYALLLKLEYRHSLIAWHAIQNHRTRIQTISSALHEFVRDEKILEAWKDIQPDIKKAKSLRDTFAHAQWEPNPKKNHVLEMRSTYVEDRIIEKTVLYPLNNIKANAAQVCGIGGDVSKFVIEVHHALRSSRKKSE
ncbi:MAG: hypothetical protein M0D54_05055 [Hyphomonadaceae bacterium JAD_PAG50586_4]|nr:MAG: hypothetical protein M0D54_05055 [Hyphomonadaceae bacterium JAD_PAG50586_4]